MSTVRVTQAGDDVSVTLRGSDRKSILFGTPLLILLESRVSQQAAIGMMASEYAVPVLVIHFKFKILVIMTTVTASGHEREFI